MGSVLATFLGVLATVQAEDGNRLPIGAASPEALEDSKNSLLSRVYGLSIEPPASHSFAISCIL